MTSGPQGVTCPRCDDRWNGYTVEHCTGCHRTFASTDAGDMHRVGTHGVVEGASRRRCLSLETMLRKRAKSGGTWYAGKQNVYGTWIWGRRQPGLPQIVPWGAE